MEQMNHKIKQGVSFFFLLFLFSQILYSQNAAKISEESLALQIHKKVNEERQKRGLAPLEWSEKLAAFAKQHSEDMANNGFFGYNNLQGEDPYERAQKYGIYCAKNYQDQIKIGIAENIVKETIYTIEGVSQNKKEYKEKTSEEIATSIVSKLMKKKENLENILDAEFISEGVGVKIDKNGEIYITEDFCMGNFPLKKENQKPFIDIHLLEKKIHDLVNSEREKRKIKKLLWNDNLAKIAYSHSEDMAKRNYFAHKSPEGKDPSSRAKEKGFVCQKRIGNYIRNGIGENIFQNHIYKSVAFIGDEAYYDYRNLDEIAESTVEGWMESVGHRENILDPGYDSEGIGIVISDSGEIYITENFC